MDKRKGIEMKYRAMIGIGSDFGKIYAQIVEALEMAGKALDHD